MRLRELEAEVEQPPHYNTVKHTLAKRDPLKHNTVEHQSRRGSMQRGFHQLLAFAKFLVVVVAVAVAFRIATRLAGIVIVVALAWVAYKLFFDGDRDA